MLIVIGTIQWLQTIVGHGRKQKGIFEYEFVCLLIKMFNQYCSPDVLHARTNE